MKVFPTFQGCYFDLGTGFWAIRDDYPLLVDAFFSFNIYSAELSVLWSCWSKQDHPDLSTRKGFHAEVSVQY